MRGPTVAQLVGGVQGLSLKRHCRFGRVVESRERDRPLRGQSLGDGGGTVPCGVRPYGRRRDCPQRGLSRQARMPRRLERDRPLRG